MVKKSKAYRYFSVNIDGSAIPNHSKTRMISAMEPNASKALPQGASRSNVVPESKRKYHAISICVDTNYTVSGRKMRLTITGCALIATIFLSGCDSDEQRTIPSKPSTKTSETEMRTLSGKIAIENLPPNRGISATIAFFPVNDERAAKPFDGDPPGDAIKDSEHLLEEVDFDTETSVATRAIPFSVSRPAGHYYIQLRFILYRFKDGKAFAQAEQFFFGKRTLPLLDDIDALTLPVKWPSIPLEELGCYGNVEPKNR
jgi:hypothetical protein